MAAPHGARRPFATPDQIIAACRFSAVLEPLDVRALKKAFPHRAADALVKQFTLLSMTGPSWSSSRAAEALCHEAHRPPYGATRAASSKI